ncbi:MAG: hypothetical protein IPI67_14645 [Myxococcales bacterium]|nr:hypothetical protein [Myxococcales bacterium]
MPLHPAVVHFPVALAVLVPLVALGVLLAWRRGWLPARTWVVVVALQAVLAVGAVVAMKTGEGDEERVEKVVREASIEAHEDAAKLFTLVGFGVLVLAAAPLLSKRDSLKQALAGASIVGSLGLVGLAYNAAHRGGQLVYAEGAGSAYTTPGTAETKTATTRDDDDD